MQRIQNITALSLFAVLALFCLGGCASSRTENGVTIESDRSYNPMSWF